MAITTYNQTTDTVKPLPKVIYEQSELLNSISLEEWMDKLDKKLVEHYGENFRIMLNESRLEQGMKPL